ncbi:hypothetical protein KUTeg_017990 [Tegillarca granosa]|uniref:Uncharacterized protein n=1 Tax=Tegillarca granosa TaxID=220873 RepID=A0ABQ9ELD9_TEGGR|nr:hypothetical protein KUTeg_017990 [Tegillarca granosa]
MGNNRKIIDHGLYYKINKPVYVRSDLYEDITLDEEEVTSNTYEYMLEDIEANLEQTSDQRIVISEEEIGERNGDRCSVFSDSLLEDFNKNVSRENIESVTHTESSGMDESEISNSNMAVNETIYPMLNKKTMFYPDGTSETDRL